MSEAAQLKQIEDRLTDLLVEADRLAEGNAPATNAPWAAPFERLRARARTAGHRSLHC